MIRGSQGEEEKETTDEGIKAQDAYQIFIHARIGALG